MNSEQTRLSRRTWLQLASGASLAALASPVSRAYGQLAPTFTNALFAGDYADPTILRVGEDFYFTHTCYRYAPQLQVWHSRDLVNWTPISYALNRTYGDIWAPDLAEHGGRYFIYFPMNGSLYVVHADNPRGPWSEPISLKVGDIDPGHVVGPDGKRYLYTAGGHVIGLSADGLSTTGERKQVYSGWQFPKEWEVEGFWLESPKLMQRGGYYYLICAEGGTSGPATSHMAVVARSKSPLGPWENSPYNPLIHTYSADEQWWSVGHGSPVSTPDGHWYFVYHGYRKNFQTLGRHTLMEPIEWTGDGWPRAPLGAMRAAPMPAPMGVAQAPMMELSDNFSAPALRATWGAWNETDMSRFQPGRGTLTIRAKGNASVDSSPLTVMARDESYEVQVVASLRGASSAALGLFYASAAGVFVDLKNGQLTVSESKRPLASRDWHAGAAALKIVNRSNRVEVLASVDGRDWQSLAADIDVSGFQTNKMHGFQALRPALAASGNGSALFSDFRYRKL